MTSKGSLIKRSILAAFIGTALMSFAIATDNTTNAAAYGRATQCPFTAKCPIDDTVSNYVQSEFSGVTEIGIYEHPLTTGGVHRFRVRCN
jgi:hypothetical protein